MKKDYKLAGLKVEGKKDLVYVPINGSDESEVPYEIMEKWQKILDLVANILNVPSGLIMKVHENSIEVLMKSKGDKNPYKVNEKADLKSGLYCETVMGKRSNLLIDNALKYSYWENNPDVKLNMISYLGFPIEWSDKKIFGTICVLDNKENNYSETYIEYLKQVKDILEQDLYIIEENRRLIESSNKNEIMIKEIHHRIKNNFNYIIQFLEFEKIVKKEKSIESTIDKIITKMETVSKLHQAIYFDNNENGIIDYFDSLKEKITDIYDRFNVKINICGDNIKLKFNTMINCGMLFNELLTNSLKYAFDGEKGDFEVKIIISKDMNNRFFMIYQDNGKGMDEESILENRNLGMQLIEAIPLQLNGSCRFLKSKGVGYEFLLENID